MKEGKAIIFHKKKKKSVFYFCFSLGKWRKKKMNYENERIMESMEAENASLNEAKAAIEKAKEAIEKAGSMCNLLHLADEADMSNLEALLRILPYLYRR